MIVGVSRPQHACTFSNRKIKYEPLKRVGVGISKMGAMRAVSISAYAFALSRLDVDVK